MKVVSQSIEILDQLDGEIILKKLELAGRTCYKSEDRITDESAKKFLANIIKSGHESVLEHQSITIKGVTNRAVSHQLVRHRAGTSYSQESQRFCSYSKDKFDNEVTFVKPLKLLWGTKLYRVWEKLAEQSEKAYLQLLEMGVNPEDAREVLINSTKTEIVITMNVRAWRHFLKIRTDKAADPSIRLFANLILREFKKSIPVLFDDIGGAR